MSKISLESKKSFFKDVLFSSKKRIIIFSISVFLVLALATTIITIVAINKNKDKDLPKKTKITIEINICDKLDNTIFISNANVYNNTNNTLIYQAPSGIFSINNYDYNFEKGDIIKIEMNDYNLSLSVPNTEKLYMTNNDIYFEVLETTTQNITIYGEEIPDERQEQIQKSISLSFKDQNQMTIKTQIKAMLFNTIPYDVTSGEYDYQSSEIKILGTTINGSMLIEIDENEILGQEIYFFSQDFNFDNLILTNEDRNTQKIVYGTIRNTVKTLKGTDIEILYPNGTRITDVNTIVTYTYINTYNSQNEYVKGQVDVREDVNTKIYFENDVMFDVMYVQVETVNGKYFYAKFYPTQLTECAKIYLTEGYKIQVLYASNKFVAVLQDENIISVIKSNQGGILEYITDNTDIKFYEYNNETNTINEELVLINVSENESLVTLNGESIIYDKENNQIRLVKKSVIEQN